MEIIFATNNENKLNEVRLYLGDQFVVKSLQDIGCLADIPETGDTLEENALQKAQYLWDRYRVACFADDSGLEVALLNGEPGVYSARYSGQRDMDKNMDLLLRKMGESENRAARFRTVIALITPQVSRLFEGKVLGTIGTKRLGSQGFGYDPLFVPQGHDKTFAQMSMEEKSAISHRSIAVQKMADFLKSQLS